MSKNHKNSPADIKHIDISISDLEAIIEHSKAEPLSDHDCEQLRSVVKTLLFLTQELEKKGISIQRLRAILFGATTEKLQNILAKALGKGTQQENESGSDDSQGNEKAKGHGRNGVEDYAGAEIVHVAHGSLNAGDDCPECHKGTVYETAEPGVIVRITGQAPLKAKIYKLQKFRCNLCGMIFTAEPPHNVGNDKYDAQSASMIALLKYGSGVPFNRLESLQGSLGIPLPAATQWEIVEAGADMIKPAFEEMIRQAAQGQVLHNDDTTMKILALCDPNNTAVDTGPPADPERKGVFTSGIISILNGLKIALFFTGRRHAGENLAGVLKHRASDMGCPIQMCDALSRNMPKELEVIVANCITHGRRRFVEAAPNFPAECLHLLEVLKDVYKNDAEAKRQGMSDEQRLHWHQTQSGPQMADLKIWLTEQIEQRKVEPNSSLGEAIAYMLKHWEKLTLFLRTPGAPLDNNVCERALKTAILHRKNAYFYKTQNGARVGDLFMSVIHTCKLNKINPFDYLTQLQKHAEAVAACPANWMPWNYRQKLTANQ
jgi:transposase